ncbi:MAG: ABC transporter C-terminal domain-containing protein [Acidobacteriota bacterium]|nr:ABC transporter C-terminal domain-containing protein [Acidobacteriota bacterium]
MNSAENRKWNIGQRLVMAFVCPTLLLLLNGVCSAQTVTATPATIADQAKPNTVVLTIKKADGSIDTAIAGQVVSVKVGDRPPVQPQKDAQGNITITPPANLSGPQTVQLLDDKGNPLSLGQVQLTYPPPKPNVTGVYRLGYRDRTGDKDEVLRNSAGLGDIIVVQVQNLQSLSNQAKCIDDATGGKRENCEKQEIALYLDGRKIEGLEPESGAPRPDEGTLQYHLQRSDKSDEAWADLLGAPPLRGDSFYRRPTEISVGLANAYAVPTSVAKFNLVRIRKYRFVAYSIVLLFIIGLLLWLAVKSDILRDIGPQPSGLDAHGQPRRKTFSLARVQMAVWFCLVVASFLYIWQITGAHDILTASVLGLIGIGAGTFLGSAVIDMGRQGTGSSQLETLQAEKATLEGEITKLKEQIAAGPAAAKLDELQQALNGKNTQLTNVNARIEQLMADAAPQASQGLIKDILTDTGVGISFHRFQMFVWTLVLVVLFVVSVWNRLSMPEFSATLLALMGISNGTYLGFKLPQSQK